MSSPDWTERLLARRFGEERASEIVGDLQEQHGPRFLPLRVLSLTASMPWPEWAAGLLFAILLALYQWPLTEYAWEIPRWFTEHHLTDGASGTWYFLLTELSYTACFLTVICVLRDLRATPRVWIGVAYSVALPVLSVLAMRPYLRPFSLALLRRRRILGSSAAGLGCFDSLQHRPRQLTGARLAGTQVTRTHSLDLRLALAAPSSAPGCAPRHNVADRRHRRCTASAYRRVRCLRSDAHTAKTCE